MRRYAGRETVTFILRDHNPGAGDNMKSSTLFAVLALLSVPGMAAAGDMAAAEYNFAVNELSQASFNQAAIIGQQGNLNNARIRQDGQKMQAVISQNGNGNRANVDQSGYYNLAYIAQDGQSNRASITQAAWGNTAMILQKGAGNRASITQYGTQKTAVVVQKQSQMAIRVVQR